MEQAGPTAGVGTAAPGQQGASRAVAAGVISAHAIEHIYSRGFLVLLTEMQVVLGLPIFQTFLLGGVQSLVGGLTSMSTGLFVDMFYHRIGQLLGLSMVLMGVGYLLVGTAPSYGVILVAIMVAATGSALWHPPALALLSLSFPRQRGLLISLHRSAGNIGEMTGPWIVLGLLLSLSWRGVVSAGVPLLLVIGFLIFISLRDVGGPKLTGVSFRQGLGSKLPALRTVVRSSELMSLLAVSAARGMGDRALLLGIPLYLRDDVGLGRGWVAFHVALFTTMAVVAGPLIGAASDRIGRKPLVVLIMAVSITFPLAMAVAGSGPGFTAAVAMYGLFLFSINSLTQAAAMDLAAGKRLEGSLIGLLWGVGSASGFAASLMAGLLQWAFDWNAVFYFGSATFALGFLASLMLPSTGVRERAHA